MANTRAQVCTRIAGALVHMRAGVNITYNSAPIRVHFARESRARSRVFMGVHRPHTAPSASIFCAFWMGPAETCARWANVCVRVVLFGHRRLREHVTCHRGGARRSAIVVPVCCPTNTSRPPVCIEPRTRVRLTNMLTMRAQLIYAGFGQQHDRMFARLHTRSRAFVVCPLRHVRPLVVDISKRCDACAFTRRCCINRPSAKLAYAPEIILFLTTVRPS